MEGSHSRTRSWYWLIVPWLQSAARGHRFAVALAIRAREAIERIARRPRIFVRHSRAVQESSRFLHIRDSLHRHTVDRMAERLDTRRGRIRPELHGAGRALIGGCSVRRGERSGRPVRLTSHVTLSRKLKYDRRGHQNELAGDVHSNATVPPPSALTVDTGANSSTRTDDTPVSLES